MNKGEIMKKNNLFLFKFTTVAMMIGFFSPSVSIVSLDSKGVNKRSMAPLQLSISLLNTAEARGGRGGGGGRGGMNRGGSMNRSAGVNRGTNRNTNRNVNRNTNVNRNVNVNHYYGGGYHGGGRYGYWGGRAIVAWTSAVVVGSWIAASTMPKTCTTFIQGGVTYRQCGSSYYRPYYQGNTVVYQVVNSPY